MLVLGIESTCDETSVAIVENGKNVLANVVASQIKEHAPWQGVVPEIASRNHLKKIIPLTEKALKLADLEINQVDLIAVANRPGLIGGLMVGVSAAKAFAWVTKKPFIAINHMDAHLYSPHISSEINFPYVGLLVSGGHTMLVIAKSYTSYEVIGTTIDDAVGEAFDKIAKFYDLGYPGGPAIEKTALNGNELAFSFPISNLYKSDRKFDVSYSGLKTAVINHLHKYQQAESYSVADIAASFQKRAFDVLLKKIELAIKEFNINTVVVAGGVSANQYLRKRFQQIKNCNAFFPNLKYATDNGAMIAAFAYHKYLEEGETSLSEGVYPRVEGFKISLLRK
ncbi:MAG: tRNA (adenosine(37)-N6)-threonylcarbamoyltransferase complex transferase subunit TsaD [Spirochaetes bacterium]|nr:tRNA (adenosine(37)-N6)-threonylcarbamoyltransferase complex transferase subunit TsaD [Spirochaetota bacterium]